MTYHTLDDWLDEIENFATRRERLCEEFGDIRRVWPWLETTWRLGGEAERAKVFALESELAAANALIRAMTTPVTDADIAAAAEEAKAIRPLIEAERHRQMKGREG